MKILAVIVDELPVSASRCLYADNHFIGCRKSIQSMTSGKFFTNRCPDCPLMTDLSYLRSRMLMQSDADVTKLKEVGNE